MSYMGHYVSGALCLGGIISWGHYILGALYLGGVVTSYHLDKLIIFQ